ncbi:MAG: hypothetical protein IT337_00275 [Thermomicrobiales bacterium]|nr:hypothetical protein [Thermomicrobiales bacterium]
MTIEHLSSAVAAWLDVWIHGSAHPEVVRAGLRHLAMQTRDQQERTIVDHAWWVVGTTPYGSVQAYAA